MINFLLDYPIPNRIGNIIPDYTKIYTPFKQQSTGLIQVYTYYDGLSESWNSFVLTPPVLPSKE